MRMSVLLASPGRHPFFNKFLRLFLPSLSCSHLGATVFLMLKPEHRVRLHSQVVAVRSNAVEFCYVEILAFDQPIALDALDNSKDEGGFSVLVPRALKR